MFCPINTRYVLAAGAGVVANVILGASSLYWKQLAVISPETLLGYRIFLSLATLALAMLMLQRFRALVEKLTWRTVGIHAAAAYLVVLNWGTFIWASIHGHVVESGLGYLIAPFIAIAIAKVVIGDTLSAVRLAGLVVIAMAVAALMLRSGELNHWVYLVIGVTWGGYACAKKLTPLDPFGGLFMETFTLCVLWLPLLAASQVSLTLPGNLPAATAVLLLVCGLVSVVPLWLFAYAAGHLPLSAMGFFQFVLPTTQLLVALVFYRQPLSNNTLLCFSVIWAALLVILSEPLWRFGRLRPRN
ncbi:rarD protein [Verminephrobacter aporrectodeae subsp. tuberculatae]|uniref:EamA family transporter n=1 Tax=Verminephrobacter aporrectodeae TaxID=1110389 RepID=UPI002237A6EA|nr:rarD protein [Verminephrobacter aporrectodeae]MCW5223341.1 rarD protein [Verminephrobacter aporrectodeae subsp. tuberculatae]MCW5288805.1 rarD protein [Verminephrobacter aporrectodeae subsp. tuberculatae]